TSSPRGECSRTASASSSCLIAPAEGASRSIGRVELAAFLPARPLRPRLVALPRLDLCVGHQLIGRIPLHSSIAVAGLTRSIVLGLGLHRRALLPLLRH